MSGGSTEIENRRKVKFIRLGGIAILLGLAIHIIANMFLKTFPSENFTPTELKEYLANEASTWEVVNGIRYLAIACIIIFSSALFIRTREKASTTSLGWGIVGLMGCILMMSNLMIANGIETLAFLNYNGLSEQEESFWLLFYVSRVLFTAEMIAWSILIFGFSMAGMYSNTIPKGLVILGTVSAVACLTSSLFVVNIMNGGWAEIIIEVASLTGLLWFIGMGFYILFLKGKSSFYTS